MAAGNSHAAAEANPLPNVVAELEADIQRISRLAVAAQTKLQRLSFTTVPVKGDVHRTSSLESAESAARMVVPDEGSRNHIYLGQGHGPQRDADSCRWSDSTEKTLPIVTLPPLFEGGPLPSASPRSRTTWSTDLPAVTRPHPEDDGLSSHLVPCTSGEGGRPAFLQLPRALWERAASHSKDHATSSFAPMMAATGSYPMSSINRVGSSIRKPLSSGGSRGKKLKLLSLWEEAYALADVDQDDPFYQPSRVHQSRRTTIVKPNLSLKTGDLLVPRWGPWRDRLANPHSPIRLVWDCLALLLISYDLAIIPVEVSWRLPEKGEGTPPQVVIGEIVYWALDMGLNFMSGFYDQGRLVGSLREIRQHYLCGWFPFDCILLLVDVIVVIAREGEVLFLVQITTWARLIRMMRVVKMRRIAQKLEEVCSAWNHRGAALLHAVVYTFALVFLLTHSIACAWYYVGNRNHRDGRDSWLHQDDMVHATLREQYILCFHWVLGQFTPAPIRIEPATEGERLFTIFVILFSLFVIGKGIQRISATVQELNAARYDDDRIRRKVRQFLAVNKVPMELALRTTKFVDNVLSRRSAVQLDNNLVSEHLRKELNTYQRERFLSKHVLFQCVFEGYPEVTSNVCEALQLQTYDKGRTVFSLGSLARCMYITSQGVYELDHDDLITEKFQDIHYFSEVSLYASFLHTSTLTAVTFSDLFTFTATDFKRCVAQFPSCSGMIIEYATALLSRLRRDETQIKDNLSEALVKQAFEATQFFKMEHVQEGAIPLELKSVAQSTARSQEEDLSLTQIVQEFLAECKSGTLEDKDAVEGFTRVFPELDTQDGIFVKMNYADERIRTLVSMTNALWLWRDNYEAFCAPQSSEVRLSAAHWRKLQLFIKWAGVNQELMHATLVLIIVRGMGNVQPLTKTFGRGASRAAKASKHILETRHPSAPSVCGISDEWQALIKESFDVHECFNLGQFMEGENLPANIHMLQDTLRQRGEGLLKLYLFATVAVMSGRDARGDVELMKGDMVPGSRFMDERRGRMVVACLEALEHLLNASAQTIYWSYMSWCAASLNLGTNTAAELALARLMCLSRSHTQAEVHQLHTAWASLEAVDRETLTDCLLADGIIERSVRFSMLPMCLANARANSVVGPQALLIVLAELLGTLKTQGCWSGTEEKNLTLDLADFASFTSAVSHQAVFLTCLGRAELRQADNRITVAMTSRNWVRATDTDSSEVELQALLHHMMVRQRALENMMVMLKVPAGLAKSAGKYADTPLRMPSPPVSNTPMLVRHAASMPPSTSVMEPGHMFGPADLITITDLDA